MHGYWQAPIAPEDRPKTAFSTATGFYEFNVLPFGLANAPSTFQRLMDMVLVGLQGEQCLVYLDDVIVFGSTYDLHLERLERVYERLQKAGMKLRPEKCFFARSSVRYLGYLVSSKGLGLLTDHVEPVVKLPVPSNAQDVKRFLGMARYYRRFIPRFAQVMITAPLCEFQRRNVKFEWNERCHAAFEELKTLLTSAPVLSFPRFDVPFVLATDASEAGLGAVLSQEISGREHVIAYASRTIHKSEKNYSATEKEALALVWATNYFRPYLFGKQFSLVTDHCPLTWLKSLKEAHGRLARWLMALSEYEWSIRPRSGRTHTNADVLSRHPIQQVQGLVDELGDGSSHLESLSHPCAVVGLQAAYSTDDIRGWKTRYCIGW